MHLVQRRKPQKRRRKRKLQENWLSARKLTSFRNDFADGPMHLGHDANLKWDMAGIARVQKDAGISEYELQKIAGLVARLQSCQCFRNFFLADAFIIRLHAEPLASTISWTSYLQSTTTSTFFWFVGTTNLFIISDSMHFRLECLSKTSNNRPSGRARKLNISNT